MSHFLRSYFLFLIRANAFAFELKFNIHVTLNLLVIKTKTREFPQNDGKDSEFPKSLRSCLKFLANDPD